MKEQEAREAAREEACEQFISNDGSVYDLYDSAWVAGVEYADRWTYCEDALPKQYDFYLVTHKTWEGDLRVSECLFAYEKWDIENVIAWRPMPDPAKIREPGPQEQVEVS